MQCGCTNIIARLYTSGVYVEHELNSNVQPNNKQFVLYIFKFQMVKRIQILEFPFTNFRRIFRIGMKLHTIYLYDSQHHHQADIIWSSNACVLLCNPIECFPNLNGNFVFQNNNNCAESLNVNVVQMRFDICLSN